MTVLHVFIQCHHSILITRSSSSPHCELVLHWGGCSAVITCEVCNSWLATSDDNGCSWEDVRMDCEDSVVEGDSLVWLRMLGLDTLVSGVWGWCSSGNKPASGACFWSDSSKSELLMSCKPVLSLSWNASLWTYKKGVVDF